ncbi:hypothetical protein Barb4_05541 [Bacteroidales bacterium Barb4]|nr:hypothetical protein Barb4_05541 [Bacteroidales bacterium Barb4]
MREMSGLRKAKTLYLHRQSVSFFNMKKIFLSSVKYKVQSLPGVTVETQCIASLHLCWKQ